MREEATGCDLPKSSDTAPSHAPRNPAGPAACRWRGAAGPGSRAALPWPCTFSRSQAISGSRSPRASSASRSGIVAPRRRHQLRRGHGAQRVAREVAEGAVVPVDVLQAAARVVGRGDAEQRARSPRSRRRAGRRRARLARDQRPLQPEAQDDMRGVGQLVGVDADEAALHAAPEPGEVVRGVGRGVAAEGRVQLAGRGRRGRRRSGRPASRRSGTAIHAPPCRRPRRRAGAPRLRAGRARTARGRSRAARRAATWRSPASL